MHRPCRPVPVQTYGAAVENPVLQPPHVPTHPCFDQPASPGLASAETGGTAMNAPQPGIARAAAVAGLDRATVVAATMDRVKGIERDQGVTRPALGAIKAEMLDLAANEALFPAAEFPPPPEGEKGAKRYLLQEDPDGRFALYMLALNPGNTSPPHDHTTWAVITAVDGQELNRVYRRTDDASTPGKATIELVREVMVEPGTGVAFMPEDIHSIHTAGSRSTRHLHVYGLALERLDERQGFDIEAGTVQPYNKAFMKPTANR